MSDREHDALLEAALTAHRERDAAGRLVPPPAWWDLEPEKLDELFEAQLLAREIERRSDSAGMSGTARAVLARLWDRMPG
jgi:hypothetical protein